MLFICLCLIHTIFIQFCLYLQIQKLQKTLRDIQIILRHKAIQMAFRFILPIHHKVSFQYLFKHEQCCVSLFSHDQSKYSVSDILFCCYKHNDSWSFPSELCSNIESIISIVDEGVLLIF
eukprot:239496_1